MYAAAALISSIDRGSHWLLDAAKRLLVASLGVGAGNTGGRHASISLTL